MRVANYLENTARRLFAQPMTPKRASSLPTDAVLAERVDALRSHRLREQAAGGVLEIVCYTHPLDSARVAE